MQKPIVDRAFLYPRRIIHTIRNRLIAEFPAVQRGRRRAMRSQQHDQDRPCEGAEEYAGY
ncbi:hypothetical protein A6456_10635 [Paraburkholderia tropica]|nr:hypothetical protein A6456_10635 [Paraburkholderia tropica]